MDILVTGCGGFIGSALADKLLIAGHRILGIDSLTEYYSTTLKKSRLERLKNFKNFHFQNIDLSTSEFESTILKFNPEMVIHLAAQPGVRLSRDEYHKYNRENLFSFISLSENISKFKIPYFLYASSSSVYGNYSKLPFSENELNLKPTSFYGSTKLINEIFCQNFFDSNTTHIGLRFFTVYGPHGRPDMSYLRLINSALNNVPFSLNGNGDIKRDFTYIDDVTHSILRLIETIVINKVIPPKVINIGGGCPTSIRNLIQIVENETKKRIEVKIKDKLSFDMVETSASYKILEDLISYKPQTTLEEGIRKTVNWVKDGNLESELRKWVDSSK